MATKEQILKDIKANNEEIKLERLEKIVKDSACDQETRKIAFIIMSEIYIKKLWFGNAAKSFLNAADLAKTFDDKKDLFFKAGELFVRTQDYFTAEDTFRKVIVLASAKDKKTTHEKIIAVYTDYAKELESKRMQTKAISVYNKILTLNLPLEEANKVRDRMAELYEKIGKPRDANWIKAQKVSAVENAKRENEKSAAERAAAEDQSSAERFIGV
jgi:hypothetical protein